MVKRYIDTATAIFRFLKAARNRAKEGMSKEQILDFARREFGEVSKLLRKQIDDIFQTKPKTQKKGEVVPIKEGEGIMATDEAADIKKVIGEKEEVGDDFIDFVRKQGDEEGANKIQKEVDRLNKAIEDADKKAKAEDTTSAPAAESKTPANPDMKPTKDFYATDYKNSRNFFCSGWVFGIFSQRSFTFLF